MDGIEKDIIMIRDVTDFTNLEDIQQKQNQELNRTNMITTQMN
jgi:hypothetical protein